MERKLRGMPIPLALSKLESKKKESIGEKIKDAKRALRKKWIEKMTRPWG